MSEDEKKENARNYLEASEKLWKEHNTTKALQFLEKAQKCWPLPEIPIYREKYKSIYDPNSAQPSSPSPSSSSFSSSSPSSSKSSSTTTIPPKPQKAPNPPCSPPPLEYTQEQQDDALKLSQLKNYYEILGLKKDAAEEDIKKAYRKLAIKMHPDKNRAPAAEDAFKKVTQAYSCLSDSSKKMQYDMFGEEGDEPVKPDLTPEQVDDMFFTSDGKPISFPSKKPRVGLLAYLRFIPVIVLLLLSFLFGNSHSSTFSLLSTEQCHLPRRTASNTPFYVSESFDSIRDPRARRAAESEIDYQYLRSVTEACDFAKKQREGLANEAKGLKGQALKEKLKEVNHVSLAECDLLKAIVG